MSDATLTRGHHFIIMLNHWFNQIWDFYGFVDLDINSFFKLSDATLTRGHNFQIVKPLVKSNLGSSISVTIIACSALFASMNFVHMMMNLNFCKWNIFYSILFFSHTKHLQINNLHIFTIVFHFRHILFLHDLLIHLFFPFHMSAKGLSLPSVHDSGIHSLLIPETRLLYQYSIPGSKHTFSKLRSLPRLFPSPLTVYPDFDSC